MLRIDGLVWMPPFETRTRCMPGRGWLIVPFVSSTRQTLQVEGQSLCPLSGFSLGGPFPHSLLDCLTCPPCVHWTVSSSDCSPPVSASATTHSSPSVLSVERPSPAKPPQLPPKLSGSFRGSPKAQGLPPSQPVAPISGIWQLAELRWPATRRASQCLMANQKTPPSVSMGMPDGQPSH